MSVASVWFCSLLDPVLWAVAIVVCFLYGWCSGVHS